MTPTTDSRPSCMDDPIWTVAEQAPDWPPPVDRTLFVLPSSVAEWYVIDDLLDELLILSGRRESTLRQYKRVYNPHTGVAPERQRPGVKYSYDREVCPLPAEQQDAMLDRIQAGEFENSDQVHAERLRIQREPDREKFNGELYLTCPICDGEHAWSHDRLQWIECAHCHAHASEVLDDDHRRRTVAGQLKRLLSLGDRGMVEMYYNVETRK